MQRALGFLLASVGNFTKWNLSFWCFHYVLIFHGKEVLWNYVSQMIPFLQKVLRSLRKKTARRQELFPRILRRPMMGNHLLFQYIFVLFSSYVCMSAYSNVACCTVLCTGRNIKLQITQITSDLANLWNYLHLLWSWAKFTMRLFARSRWIHSVIFISKVIIMSPSRLVCSLHVSFFGVYCIMM